MISTIVCATVAPVIQIETNQVN